MIVLFTQPACAATVPAKETVQKPKTVYLTFDADMTRSMEKKLKSGKVSSWYSAGLVSYLEQKHISSTIFVTGMFAELYPGVVRELAQTPGVVIGNHTYDHSAFESPCYKLPMLSTDQEKKDEITKTQDILKPLVGYAPTYFRYPGLCRDAHDDTIVTSLGLVVADNGIASGDAFNKNTKSIVTNVLSQVKDGSVVIMHLGGPNATGTEVALKKIVPTLEQRGYVFKAL